MKLSVIVVSYNVKYFLNICLKSLQKAIDGMNGEIIVIDNASEDGSQKLLRNNFSGVRRIENKENIGFGRACNQGIDLATGEYVLIINPDTLVGESLLPQILEMMDQDLSIGALGIRLMDGKGNILRESKRTIPTLWSGFTKFSGLGELFKKSAFFNQYYAPELRYDEVGEVEVLPGAFMLIRRSVLNEIGGFDPRFFMYAEDIDLSYRISKAGYKIMYAGHLSAIHFKGESTQKSLWSYTDTFFTSMKLFVQKYTEELYSVRVSWVLQRMILAMLWIQGVWKTRFKRSRMSTPLHLGEWNLLLSKNPDIARKLEKLIGQSVAHVPEKEIDDFSPAVYLRYITALVRTRLNIALFLDVNSLSFDQIFDLWRDQNGRSFYLLDRKEDYFISSADKRTQGQIYFLDNNRSQ